MKNQDIPPTHRLESLIILNRFTTCCYEVYYWTKKGTYCSHSFLFLKGAWLSFVGIFLTIRHTIIRFSHATISSLKFKIICL